MLRRAVLVVTLAGVAAAQDPAELLTRARAKVAGITRRLLKYTCLETIERTYYAVSVEEISGKILTEPQSCDKKEFGKNGHLSLRARDRLRLEVAVSGGKEISEIYSWAATSRFDSRSIFEMVSTGPITSGAFGTYLIDVFQNPAVRFSFLDRKGETFEYSFEAPVEASHYSIKVGNEWKVTGYHGLVQINAATADLALLIEETERLPSGGEACLARTSIVYHYVPIGDGKFLVPRETELQTLSPDASETTSVTNYSACHEYSAESTVRFDGGADAPGAKTAPPAPIKLPAGVSLSLALMNSIDTNISAAGDAVSAKVLKDVRAKGSKAILVPAGAVAHGRILQMRHQYSTSQFQIAIRFGTLEIQGTVSPISVRLERDLKAEAGEARKALRNRATEFSLPPLGEKGSMFVFSDRSGRLVLQAGFESKWVTVGK